MKREPTPHFGATAVQLLRQIAAVGCCMLLMLLGGCKICADDDCVHGECKSGRCQCEEGWQGAECDQVEKARFSGLYAVEDRCTWGGTYVKIIGGVDGHDLRVIGLHGQPDTLYAEYDKDLANWFNIPNQSISPPGFTISGSAETQGGGRFSVNYSTRDLLGDPVDICLARLTKQ